MTCQDDRGASTILIARRDGSGRRGQCQGEAAEDEIHVRSGGCLIVGLGDVEGCLVYGADQDVGQGLDGLGPYGAAVDAVLEKGGDEPDGVAQADFPPPVPPQHRWAVEQDYALQIRFGAGVEPGIGAGQEHAGGVGWVEAGHGAGDPLGDLSFDFIEDGSEQVGFVGELVIEGAAGHACLSRDALGAHFGIAFGAEQTSGRGDQRSPGLCRPLALGPSPGRCAQLTPPQLSYTLYVSSIQDVWNF